MVIAKLLEGWKELNNVTSWTAGFKITQYQLPLMPTSLPLYTEEVIFVQNKVDFFLIWGIMSISPYHCLTLRWHPEFWWGLHSILSNWTENRSLVASIWGGGGTDYKKNLKEHFWVKSCSKSWLWWWWWWLLIACVCHN